MNETLNPVKQEFQGQNKKIKGYKNRLQRKLKLMEDISQIELFIDETLGKIFGQVQSLENEKRCFSTSQASSIVFTLVKMNSIIYEKNFLNTFLNTLSFNIAKEFMVFNYAIFTDQRYVANIINNDDYIEGIQHYREERRKETIINYISNWSLVVNDFKDTTEYSTKKDTVSRLRRFGSLFRRGLTWIWKKVLGFKMDTLDNFFFSIFFRSLFASLPTARIFSNLNDFITEIVGHWFGIIFEVIKQNKKSAKKIIWEKTKSNFLKIWNRNEFDLDYTKYLNTDSPNNFGEKPETKVKANKLEEAYKEATRDFEDPDKLTNHIYLFNEKSKNLEIYNADSPWVFKDFESPEVKQEIDPKEMQRFLQYVEGDPNLTEIRKETLGLERKMEKRPLVVV